jgi:hypothetical protein
MLKDIQYPKHKLPDNMKANISDIVRQGVRYQTLPVDLLELLLILLIDSDLDRTTADYILWHTCSTRYEVLAKRLLDEGYSSRVLKREYTDIETLIYRYDNDIRQRLLAHGRPG